jgi:hypothetical protein
MLILPGIGSMPVWKVFVTSKKRSVFVVATFDTFTVRVYLVYHSRELALMITVELSALRLIYPETAGEIEYSYSRTGSLDL